MKKIHDVESLFFTDECLVVKADGGMHHFRLADISQRLCAASQSERERYEISPSGYGIHWPLLDEDLSIDALLGIRHTSPFEREPVTAKIQAT